MCAPLTGAGSRLQPGPGGSQGSWYSEKMEGDTTTRRGFSFLSLRALLLARHADLFLWQGKGVIIPSYALIL